MLKWITPLAVAATLCALTSGPVAAQRYLPPRGEYHEPGRLGNRRDVLAARARQIEQRAGRLYRDGHLSRDHYDRTLDKLGRIRNDVNRGPISQDRFDADQRWLDQVANTLDKWRR